MNQTLRSGMITGALALTAVACGATPGPEVVTPPAPSATVAPAASSAASLPSASAAPPKAEAPADPVRQAAAKAAACADWTDPTSTPWECPDFKVWDDLEALKDGVSDAKLVAMLDDPNPKMQTLGLRGLRGHGRKYRDDAAMAEKIIATLEAAKLGEDQLTSVADVAGRIDAEKTKLGPRMLELGKKITSIQVRASFISSAQFMNSDLMYPITSELARSEPNAELRRAAIASFWVGTPSSKREEVCALWTTIAQDPKTPDKLAAAAADYAAWTPNTCDKQYDALAKLLDQKLKPGVQETDWVSAGTHFVEQATLKAPLKKKMVGLLKTIAADPKTSSSARNWAVDAVVKQDPPAGKALLGKLAKDKDEWVKKHAVEALAELAKKKDEPAKK